ncbi:hypothetical protein BS50DRAFT_346663 [Corynespora cassiicola Philippines]|uniref:Uncharacterized protein n=1 Tax=Corynespora cassiicola Philippines TaxID=1448308 RepID=A0A2T2NQG0_CORCC|nr:hypothetical protein BS50DRAFT_346663 [Corynespora cassiicola Philippines]
MSSNICMHLDQAVLAALHDLADTSDLPEELRLQFTYQTASDKTLVHVSAKRKASAFSFSAKAPRHIWQRVCDDVAATGGIDVALHCARDWCDDGSIPTDFRAKIVMTDVPPAYDDVAAELKLKVGVLEKGAGWMRRKFVARGGSGGGGRVVSAPWQQHQQQGQMMGHGRKASNATTLTLVPSRASSATYIPPSAASSVKKIAVPVAGEAMPPLQLSPTQFTRDPAIIRLVSPEKQS